MKPTIGKIVHYRSYGTPGGEYTPQCRAAVVTQTIKGFMDAPLTGLAVLNPSGLFFEFAAQEDPAGCASDKGGTWHWPDREED